MSFLLVLFFASIIAAIALPWMAVEAYKAFCNQESTRPYTIVMCLCNGIIVFTILMMLNEGFHLV